jgi:hypothetical protein
LHFVVGPTNSSRPGGSGSRPVCLSVLPPNGDWNICSLGFRYWKNPGPFVQYDGISGAKGQFLGWWAVMSQAAFSYMYAPFPFFYALYSDIDSSGTEIVAVRFLGASIRTISTVLRSLRERPRTPDAIFPKPSNAFIFGMCPSLCRSQCKC